MFPDIILVWAMQQRMVSMAPHNVVFKNGVVRTKLLISHLLLIIDYYTWYLIKAQVWAFHLYYTWYLIKAQVWAFHL